MEYSITEEDQYMLVQLSGKLVNDNDIAKILEDVQAIIDEKDFQNSDTEIRILPKLNILIDLSELELMSSSGLSLLVRLLTKARKTGGECILIQLPDYIANLMLITKLESIFNIKNSLDEAIDALKLA